MTVIESKTNNKQNIATVNNALTGSSTPINTENDSSSWGNATNITNTTQDAIHIKLYLSERLLDDTSLKIKIQKQSITMHNTILKVSDTCFPPIRQSTNYD